MNIDVDWDKVIEITPHIEGDDCYTIAFVFDDYQVCTYGYSNQKEFLKDYTGIMCGDWRKRG